MVQLYDSDTGKSKVVMPPIRTKPARRAPPKLARAGGAIIAALARKTKFVDPALTENWPVIAGAEIASLCRPGRVTGRSGGGGRTLEIIAPSGAAAAQVQMHADDLLARINRYLGAGSVRQISIRQSGRQSGRQAGPRTVASGRLPDSDETTPLGLALSSFRSAVSRKNNEK